jgi:Tol biopolymer transport system component
LYGPFFGPFVYYFEPAWSPDGKSFAVTKCARTYEPCTPSSFVTIAGRDGSNPRDLVQTAGYARPSWSPDGNFIAYSYTPCYDCTRTAELRWVSADGLARGLITTQGYGPSWKR